VHQFVIVLSLRASADSPLCLCALQSRYRAFREAHPFLSGDCGQNANDGFFENAGAIKVLFRE
jgi:hypothetical protein